jgi:hypothetical protein
MSDQKETNKCRVVFAGTSVVLVTSEMELSQFKPVWLAKMDMLKPEEISPSCLITPHAIQIPTEVFNLLILPEKLQMVFAEDREEVVVEPLNRILGGILTKIGPIPARAMGVNFDYFFGPAPAVDFGAWNRKLFSSVLSAEMTSETIVNHRFGSYVSFAFEGFRLKIKFSPVKGAVAAPAIIEQLQNATEWMQANFNFHLDLSQNDPTGAAHEALLKWKKAADKAREILHQIPSGI